jgi:hypothetical protein
VLYADTTSSDGVQAVSYALFTAILQTVLTTYVVVFVVDSLIAHEEDEGEPQGWEQLAFSEEHAWNYSLATIITALSIMMVWPSIRDALHMNQHLGFLGSRFLKFADLLCNVLVPVVLVPTGVFLIVISETLMDQVLNSVALMFIPELDEQLPEMLGLPVGDLFEDCVTKKALREFIQVSRECCPARCLKDTESEDDTMDSGDLLPAAGPGDMSEGGGLMDLLIAGDGSWCDPGGLRKVVDMAGSTVVSLCNVVGAETLLGRIEYCLQSHTHSKTNETTKELAWVRLWKLDGSPPCEISSPGFEGFEGATVEALTGVFILVDFEISIWISTFRLLGSTSRSDFKSSMEYYGMWEINAAANALLARRGDGIVARQPPATPEFKFPPLTSTMHQPTPSAGSLQSTPRTAYVVRSV